MPDREKIVEIFSKLRNYADNDVHSVVNPENWHIYSKLCDLIDEAEEDVLVLLKDQEKKFNELEEKLRVLEYGDPDTLKSAMMPTT